MTGFEVAGLLTVAARIGEGRAAFGSYGFASASDVCSAGFGVAPDRSATS